MKRKTETDHIADTRAALVQAALPHVTFDGWSDTTFNLAVTDADVDAGLSMQACPRKGLDLAIAYHRTGDAGLAALLAKADLADMRFRDRVAYAVKERLLAADKEAVRRGMALFALPQNAPEGAKLLWETADTIWIGLGDTSDDLNWYTKRASLSAVYSSTVLFWLGDTSENAQDTWDFLDRRIENVMQFEKLKARFKDTPIAKGLNGLFDKVTAPSKTAPADLPGHIKNS